MTVSGGRKSTAFFVTLGVCLVALAAALNVGWILLTWQNVLMLVAGITVFAVIIAGLVLNAIFLVREIRRNEAHDAFINAMTHELKTPLASIRLYLETLQRRDVDEAKRREFYATMLQDSDRLLGTIEQVLRAGRVARGRRELNVTPVDVADLVEECLRVARRQHALHESELTVQGLPERRKLTITGDLDELRAALSNLIDNAVKYSKDQVQVRVEVEELPGERVAIRVRDRGVGMAPGELRHVFKRFYRIPGAVATRVKGTGLGLFIVQSVAKKHGGRAYAESAGPGRGSTFTVELPIAAETAMEAPR